MRYLYDGFQRTLLQIGGHRKGNVGLQLSIVFIWGTVSGVTGLFRSTDQGATWLRMNDDAHEFAGAPLPIGDMNVPGSYIWVLAVEEV